MGFEHIIALILGNTALIVPLFLWNRSESRADIRHMDSKFESYMTGIREEIKAIHDEMKDFHGRLERQDAEFKGKMAKQDAEFKGRMEKQDAEFKAHLMYGHQEKLKKSNTKE